MAQIQPCKACLAGAPEDCCTCGLADEICADCELPMSICACEEVAEKDFDVCLVPVHAGIISLGTKGSNNG